MDKKEKNFDTLVVGSGYRDRDGRVHIIAEYNKGFNEYYDSEGYNYKPNGEFFGDLPDKLDLVELISLPEPAAEKWTIAPLDHLEEEGFEWFSGTTADCCVFLLAKKKDGDGAMTLTLYSADGSTHKEGDFSDVKAAKKWLEDHNREYLLKFLLPA